MLLSRKSLEVCSPIKFYNLYNLYKKILSLFLLCIIEYSNGLRMTILTSCSYFRFYFDWFVKT